ncbi:MAG: phosphoribosylpyrophosphate synthetase [Flavobacteriales bacterium]|nr:phosphoribosylpyrophosphate synthetase [Flavobacteriales bacterium]
MTVKDNQYATLSNAVEDLRSKGYTDELTLTEDGLFNDAGPLDPAEFKIDSFHRFEGMSDPADMSIVYAISNERAGLKGLLVGDYGAKAQDFIHTMVSDLKHSYEGNVKPVQPVKPHRNTDR